MDRSRGLTLWKMPPKVLRLVLWQLTVEHQQQQLKRSRSDAAPGSPSPLPPPPLTDG